MKERVIRADYNDDTITIYQAYNELIANHAVLNQTFVSPPFKKERMTWIKPSFLWMMYRCGWAQKENQERILAIKIKREGFEWALNNSSLSRYHTEKQDSYDDWKVELQKSPVRIQWDPERDIALNPLPYRSIQIGIKGIAVDKYLSEWIVQIEDITEKCKSIQNLINKGLKNKAMELIPQESLYPLTQNIATKINSF
ncbi:conserved hypothetical protein [Tenacibaculum litopenaei]|uniref:DUF4291 domain-containing protein n=1 Tax=Tenacibaculum litopenaei TaxID=396016 RepID=UPI00389513D0